MHVSRNWTGLAHDYPSVEISGEAATAPTRTGRAGLAVCAGCCCGRRGLETDRLRRFAEAHPDVVEARSTGCLGRCDYADVVVVRPSPAGRRPGGRPVWFGMLDAAAVDAIERWVCAGGPGAAELPGRLAMHQISRPGLYRSKPI